MRIWRSLFDARCRQAILGRIQNLRAEAVAQWGSMSAPQMVAHLTDQMSHALGDQPVEPMSGPLRLAPVRWASIYLLPWPKGRISGPPEAFHTQPASWSADVAGLVDLVRRFAARGPEADWPEHALFGRMSGRDWGVFCHKHFDYHLRQFEA